MAKLAVLVRPMVQGTHTDSALTTVASICIPPAQARADAQPERQGRNTKPTALTLNSKFKSIYFLMHPRGSPFVWFLNLKNGMGVTILFFIFLIYWCMQIRLRRARKRMKTNLSPSPRKRCHVISLGDNSHGEHEWA